MSNIKLKECGDTELWVVYGNGWSLPVYAHPYENSKDRYYQVTQAVAFNHVQFEAVDRMLSVDSMMPYERFWLLTEEDLCRFATRAQGVTPARYVQWGQQTPAQAQELVINEKEAAKTGLNAGFLNYVNGKHQLTKRTAQLRFIWFVLCSEMAQWLHHKQGTLDLGFARIDAVPYRNNWKQVLLSKFPNFMSIIRKFRKMPAFLANLALTDFPSELRRTDLVAMGGEPHDGIGWSLEISPSESWTEFVADSEARLLQTKGKTSYVSYWKQRVDMAESQSIRIFRSFVEETSKPCGAIRESRNGGGRRLVPFVPNGRLLPVSTDSGADVVVTKSPDMDHSGSRNNNDTATVVEENAKMPEVSVIRFKPPKLWIGANDSAN